MANQTKLIERIKGRISGRGPGYSVGVAAIPSEWQELLELRDAARQAFTALVGSSARADSVQGKAKARLREALRKADSGFIGND